MLRRPTRHRGKNPRALSERLEPRQLMTRLVDFDTDGDLDAYYASSWYENVDGQGNLRSHAFTNAAEIQSQVADLDGDGDLDFVTSEPKWYENLDGRGRSFAPHSFVQANRAATRMRVQDVGGDGDNDVILFHDTDVTWYENRGAGQDFAFRALPPISNAFRLIDAADLDRDGDLDVTLSGTTLVEGLEAYTIFLGVSDGQGGYATQILGRNHPFDIQGGIGQTEFMDIDGDGFQDVVTRFYSDGRFYSWFRNDATRPGTLLPLQQMFFIGPLTDVHTPIGFPGQDQDTFVDWDHDGDLDAAGLLMGDSAGHLWQNQLGVFTSHSTSARFDRPRDLSPTITSVGDLNGDGTMDWVTATIQNNAPLWFNGKTGALHQNRLPPALQPGDANRDLYLDEADLIAVAKSARWQLSATWTSGDWNGAPGGTIDAPPAGDGRFDQTDLSALQATNLYQKGAYAPTEAAPNREWEAMRTSLGTHDLVVSYDAATGRVELHSALQFSALQLHSMAGLFTSAPALLSGPFDLATAHDLFRFDLNGFGVFELGAILPPQLSWEQVQSDLKIDGARINGGPVGSVQLTCTGCGLDVEAVRKAVATGSHSRWNDLNGDAVTNVMDLVYLLTERLQSSVGDADLDGQFHSTDLLQVFQRGKYESTADAAATWSDGDWNGDSRFDSADLLLAFQYGQYDDIPASPVAVQGDLEFRTQVATGCECAPELSSESVVDLDGDGDRDLLVSSYRDGRVTWYENLDGLGTFGDAQVITTQIPGVSTAIASDVDGDGDLDVLASSMNFGYGMGQVHWFENIGGANVFHTVPHVLSDTGGAYRMALGDLDRDGDADLVLGRSYSDDRAAVIWYRNDGKGSFSNPTTLDTGLGSRYLSVLDLDGDGDLDVFSASDHVFLWLQNDGTGKFTEKSPVSAGSPSAFDFGDINGDGRVDVLAAGNESIDWFNYRNDTFQRRSVRFENRSIASAQLVDIDRDGDRDIAFAAYPESLWLPNDGRGVFGEARGLPTLANDRSMQFADLDGDGDQDLVDGVVWYENKAGRFLIGESIQPLPANSRNVEVVDFDQDQDLDWIGARWYRHLKSLETYEELPLESRSGWLTTYSYDLDQDGDLDLIAHYQSNLYWRENENGEGFLGEPRSIRQPDSFDRINQLAFEDVDLDGDADIIAGMDSRLVWFENLDGRGQFELNREKVIDGNGTFVALMADLDGDGRRDLLTGTGWFPRQAAGDFGARRNYPGVSGLEFVGANDLDLDGDLDLLVSDAMSSYWIENLGGGQFQFGSRLRSTSTSLDAADVDLDGDVDVIFSDWSGEIGWLERVSGVESSYLPHKLYNGPRAFKAIGADYDEDGDIDILVADENGISRTENRRLRL